MVNCNCCRLELNFSRIRAQPTATIAPEAAKDGVQRLLSQWSSRKVDESTRSNLRSIGSLTTKRDVLESSFTKHIPLCFTSTYVFIRGKIDWLSWMFKVFLSGNFLPIFLSELSSNQNNSM